MAKTGNAGMLIPMTDQECYDAAVQVETKRTKGAVQADLAKSRIYTVDHRRQDEPVFLVFVAIGDDDYREYSISPKGNARFRGDATAEQMAMYCKNAQSGLTEMRPIVSA